VPGLGLVISFCTVIKAARGRAARAGEHGLLPCRSAPGRWPAAGPVEPNLPRVTNGSLRRPASCWTRALWDVLGTHKVYTDGGSRVDIYEGGQGRPDGPGHDHYWATFDQQGNMTGSGGRA
jgi:hypothetical protein